MFIVNEPSVYLVSYMQCNESEVTRLLEDHNVKDWKTDAESDIDALVEIAGRLCFMSFKKPRPGGNEAYLEHIKELGHGCYDIETEVLTAVGWKHWPNVTMEDRLATINPFGVIQYHNPINLIQYEHNGRMYRVKSKAVDLLVTPNHNMYVCPTTTKEGRDKENFRLIRADELGAASHAYMKSGKWISTGQTMSADIAELLGFVIGDGNIQNKTIRFHLRRERKIIYLKKLLERISWEWRSIGDKYTVYIDPSYQEMFESIYDDKRKKQIPPDILMCNNKRVLESLYLGLMESDGHYGNTHISYSTISYRLAGQIQQLALHIGIAANIGKAFPCGFSGTPRYTIHLLRRLKPEVNKWSGTVAQSSWINDWSGTVYCAEVPNNTLYVRRNGKPIWCGNSVLEHGVYSFIFTGVSRTLTHELVRHRAGWGYSQLSQRFFDESEAEFIIPPLIEEIGSETLKEEWRKHMAASIHRYNWLVEQLEFEYQSKYGTVTKDTQTTMRKRVREAARSVLPNATETKIYCTANARAVRHFLEMRGDLAADAEIRRLALKLLPIVRDVSPEVFADYEVQKADDGREFISTNFRKV